MTEKGLETLDIEALNKEADRQLAIVECKNLINKVIFHGAAWLNEKIIPLWAEREDDKLEMPWGIYDGIEGVKRFYLKDLGDRHEEGQLDKIKGCMMWYATDTPIVVVAGDQKTAKGLWTSQGVDTWREGDAHPDAYWRWGYYAVDFIKEEEGWKIWHMTFYPLFLTRYEEPWTEAPAYDFAFYPVSPDRPRQAPLYSYGADKLYRNYAPEIPEAYESYEG